MSKFIIVITLMLQGPNGQLLVNPIVDLELRELAACERQAKLLEEAARDSLDQGDNVDVQCVPMESSNISRMIQTLR